MTYNVFGGTLSLTQSISFKCQTRDVVLVLTASKFCEKYYGQDSRGASHLAMTNLSKLCTALTTLNSPTTVS